MIHIHGEIKFKKIKLTLEFLYKFNGHVSFCILNSWVNNNSYIMFYCESAPVKKK